MRMGNVFGQLLGMRERFAFRVILFLIIFSLILIPVASAKEKEKKVKVLKPESSSEIILDSVTYTENEYGQNVRIIGSRVANGIPEGYHIQINVEKGTYKTVKKENPVLLTSDESLSTAKLSEPSYVNNSFETLSTTYWTAWVQTVTDDPVGEDLVSTKLRLTWADYGTTIGFISNELTTWTAFPSSFGTHWYLDNKTLFDPYLYYENQKLDQQGSARYYNYDFMNTALRTDVGHWIKITTFNNETYSYVVDWGRDGEYWWLLDLDVYTN
ncbi:MAG: hypothetical protein KGZ96_09235 [Clostridia bacterium]|nr:hypothetical protein [Clostridia bacterium]